MGSSASYAADPGRLLVLEIEVLARRSVLASGEMDVPGLIRLLDTAIDDLSKRDQVIAYLAPFLARCLTGSVPDHRLWSP